MKNTNFKRFKALILTVITEKEALEEKKINKAKPGKMIFKRQEKQRRGW